MLLLGYLHEVQVWSCACCDFKWGLCMWYPHEDSDKITSAHIEWSSVVPTSICNLKSVCDNHLPHTGNSLISNLRKRNYVLIKFFKKTWPHYCVEDIHRREKSFKTHKPDLEKRGPSICSSKNILLIAFCVLGLYLLGFLWWANRKCFLPSLYSNKMKQTGSYWINKYTNVK